MFEKIDKTLGITIGIALVIFLVSGSIYLTRGGDVNIGSVGQAGEYKSTLITSADASSTAVQVLKDGAGTLGSIVISSTSPITTYPSLKIYDHPSSSSTATSTLVAQISGTGQVAGTYTFDSEVYTGLIIEVPAGFNGVYTVTYR